MTKLDERFKRSIEKQCVSGKLTYAAAAKRNGVSASMVMLLIAESYFQLLKRERIRRKTYGTREEAKFLG